jgi:lipoyl(octanoyl) transferase
VSEHTLDVIEAGRVPYAQALAWQREMARARIAGRAARDLLLLVEHPPVITLGRGAHRENVVHPEGVDVFEIERGGDVTFHGPGQLVGYPILDLTAHRRDLHWYLRTLEHALIAALATLGLPAERRAPHTGVWTRGRKIASIGVHVRQWVTWHGFALNVTTDLSSFDRIVPCGIVGVEMTSVARERDSRGEAAAGAAGLWSQSVAAVILGFERAFGFRATTAPKAYVEELCRGTAPLLSAAP